MKLYKFISHCLFFLWVVFLTGCGEQSPAEEFTATLPELATETVRFSDSSQRNKDYFPVIVTWEYDRQIRRGEPASFNVMVTNMRDMI
ncbi:MAG: hypothetical protein KDK27_17660, partial [Leptospiraceae bacterium]|nr:hypothetical protein [Leptospiraceae bacterium]